MLVFFFGLFWGSFLKVLADRLPKGESPIGGRSYCEYCKHVLGVMDLLPVVSFLLSRGRCRYCKKSLSLTYPLSEILTGVVFATPVLYLNYELGIIHSASSGQVNYEYFLQLFFFIFVLSGMVVIFFSDIKYYIIPFQVLLPSLAVVTIWQWYFHPEMIVSFLVSGLSAFIFFLLIFLLTRGRGMGFGDVIYAMYMGVVLGFPGIIVGLYVAFLTGAMVSIILILTGKKKLKGGVIPFGPFLIFGTFIAMFWGVGVGKIIMSYLYL